MANIENASSPDEQKQAFVRLADALSSYYEKLRIAPATPQAFPPFEGLVKDATGRGALNEYQFVAMKLREYYAKSEHGPSEDAAAEEKLQQQYKELFSKLHEYFEKHEDLGVQSAYGQYPLFEPMPIDRPHASLRKLSLDHGKVLPPEEKILDQIHRYEELAETLRNYYEKQDEREV